ncbi:MAG: lactonase family protein [Oenococcus sp.]|uniref:lactonase family protein n=1 Tax=Oenococcus sp. TaxID=1979414 RepID=UPI0039E92510
MSYKLLFGTYTKSDSKGLYEAFLSDDGKINNLENVAQIGSPTYFALSNAGLLYAVDKQGDRGGVSVWDTSTMPFTKTDEQISNGASPAYVFVDEGRQLVFTGNYHTGLITIFKIDGQKLIKTDDFQNEGKGPKAEQDSAHIHFTSLTPDNRLVAVDLGTDEVLTFEISQDGKLSEPIRFRTEAGFGPRHIRFSEDGKRAFLLGELSSKLSLLKYQEGKFKLISTISTIPADWTKHNGAAAIRLSDDYKYIYTSNRGYNSIAVFKIADDENDVKLIQQIPTEGDFPRDFNITPDGRYLVAVNQNTNNASSYAIDKTSGELALIQKDFYVPEAVRVYFQA